MIKFSFFVFVSFLFFYPSTYAMDNDQAQLIAYIKAMMDQKKAANPNVGPVFQEKIRELIDSTDKKTKISEIIALIKSEDPFTSFQEKAKTIAKYLPNTFSSNVTFSEAEAIDIGKALAQQNPSALFQMIVNPDFTSSDAPYLAYLSRPVKGAIFETFLDHKWDLETQLTILERGKDCINLTRIFNEYLKLKSEFKAPYIPKSFYILETPQDLIAAFYVRNLAKVVPNILLDEKLNLDLKEKLIYARRCKYDFFADNCYAENTYKTPQGLIDFYNFVARSTDIALTSIERFKVLKELFSLSSGKEKQLLLDVLQNTQDSFDLRHKLAHFAKHSSDQELQVKGHTFITEHQEAISKDAKERYDQLSVHSRMGIPALRQKGASGKNVTIAICDLGFFKVLPQDIYTSHLMKEFASDEKSYQWKLLHKDQLMDPLVMDAEWLSVEKCDEYPYHGSEMIDLAATIAPEAKIKPVAIDNNSSSILAKAFDILADDSNVNIISCSFIFPAASGALDPNLKQSLMKCLKNNKLVFVGVGNHGESIPATSSDQRGVFDNIGKKLSDLLATHTINEGLRVLSTLFQEEDEASPLFSNLLLVGSSKVNSLELHEKSVKPGDGRAQKCFVYLDADHLKNFFSDAPDWGGTSAATAMLSGIGADLWSQVKDPNAQTAARVSRAIRENTDINENLPHNIRGCGKVNAEKALENLHKY